MHNSANYQSLDVFISFASDVDAECNIAKAVVSNVNYRIRKKLNVSIESTTWKEMPASSPPGNKQIQDEINEAVKECHIFVLVLNQRYGTKKSGQEESNLEVEVDIAIERLKKEQSITFLAYFKKIPSDAYKDPGKQLEQLLQFKSRLDDQEIFYHEFTDHYDFKDRFTHDLYHTLLNFLFSSKKHKALSKLWQFGQSDRQTFPRLAIVYPPVDRKFLKPEDPDQFWLSRLVPHIVFEDHKAIEKIEKTLRLIKFNEFRVFTTVDAPSDYRFMNRIWLCWPRNIYAKRELKRYSDISMFKFLSRKNNSKSGLFWRHSPDSNNFIKINTPLTKYLKMQRKNMAGGEWSVDKGRIIGKDFAIIARFNDKRMEETKSSISLKDYFIGGIRGLGTWGAAWYIDRRWSNFKNIERDEIIQILLEVLFENGRIVSVKDVSNQPESYFRKENKLQVIRKNVERYLRNQGF